MQNPLPSHGVARYEIPGCVLASGTTSGPVDHARSGMVVARRAVMGAGHITPITSPLTLQQTEGRPQVDNRARAGRRGKAPGEVFRADVSYQRRLMADAPDPSGFSTFGRGPSRNFWGPD